MTVSTIENYIFENDNMYHPARASVVVVFDDGEKVGVRLPGSGSAEPEALGLCFQEGESHADYGRAAEAAVLVWLTRAE